MKDDAVAGVRIPIGKVLLEGELYVPEGGRGIVLFAHGSGSSRHSTRNQYVARVIRDRGMGTLLFDLLTAEEEEVDLVTRHLRFDVGLLADRLTGAFEWVQNQPESEGLSTGFFGASTGGAAALIAAARLGATVGAVVSRGGRPDLAGLYLAGVRSPTLLIVGGRDDVVLGLNRQAFAALNCLKQLKVIPGATHLFEEPGALEEVARLAAEWFRVHLTLPAEVGMPVGR